MMDVLKEERRNGQMKISILGIDLGKTSCSIVGCDGSGGVVLRRRVRRENLVDVVAKLAPGIVAMEACCGAHHLGRVFGGTGIEVRLIRRIVWRLQSLTEGDLSERACPSRKLRPHLQSTTYVV